MIKRRASRGKRATNKDPAPMPPAPESPWVVEQIDPEKDALKAERDERRRRLDDLHRLMNGVR